MMQYSFHFDPGMCRVKQTRVRRCQPCCPKAPKIQNTAVLPSQIGHATTANLHLRQISDTTP
jgi:hypothetical protein